MDDRNGGAGGRRSGSGRIPATIVTGFLGAGKTSLLRHLAQNNGGRRLAFLINEFGDLGVDREVLMGCGIPDCRDDDVIELANGCLCCTVADDFLPAMERLIARDPPPDHIVIETSGLALPKPLVRAFAWPEVRSRLTADGVIAIVDGDAVLAGRFASDPAAVGAQRSADGALDHETPLEELFEEQCGAADLVLINKADRVAADRREAVEAALRPHLRPGVRWLWTSAGRIDPAVVLGLGMAAEDDLDSRKSHHDGTASGAEHDHDDFRTFVVDLPPLPDWPGFEARLRSAVALFPILRVKGFLALRDKPMRMVVQGVGDRIERYFDRPWGENEGGVGRLVVIGLTDPGPGGTPLDPAVVRRILLPDPAA